MSLIYTKKCISTLNVITLTLTTLIFTVLNTSPQAEVRPQGFDLSISSGYWEGGRAVDGSSYFVLGAGYHISRLFTLELNHGWIPTRAVEADELNIIASDKSDMLIQQGALDILLNLSPHRFTPFFNLGVGWVHAEDTHLAADLGIGFRYFVTRDLAVRFRMNMWIGNFNLRAQPYEHFTTTLGLSYSLSGDRDIDKDGITNTKDKCPTTSEDIDQFEDQDGCPEKDNDNDKIPDSKDQCPNDPEDKDGDRDEDGCPDQDDDNDGVPNEEDQCKNKAEDKDNFQDEDGCPDLDNDKDEIPDTEDKCPDVPESKNGFQDEDGCPENDTDEDGIFDSIDQCKSKKEVFNGLKDEDGCPDAISQETQDLMGIQPSLKFRKNQAKLVRNRSSEQYLNMLATALKTEPINIKITATSHDGQDDKKVSAARVRSIRDLLIERGVDKKQIRIVARGDAELPMEYAEHKMKKDWVLIEINLPKPKK